MPRKLVVRALLPLVVAASPLQARVAELTMETLVTPAATGEQVTLRLDWPDAATHGTLTLDAARLHVADTGHTFRKLHWTCRAERAADGALTCDGELRATGIAKSTLRVAWADNQLALRFAQAKASIDVSGPAATAPQWRVATKRLPAPWLQSLLAPLWPDASLTAGNIDTTLAIGTADDGTLTVAGPLKLVQLGLDTTDGSIAAAGIDADGRIDLRIGPGTPAPTRVAGTLKLTGGELLAGTVYASLPSTPVDVAWTLDGRSDAWTLAPLRWTDPGTLAIDASATLDTSAASPLRTLQARIDMANAATAIPRYFDSTLGSLGLTGLRTAGALTGTLALRDGSIDQLDLDLARLDLADAADRFAIDGLTGAFRLHRGDAPRDGTLAWRAASVHGIALGPAAFSLRSRDGGLALTQPTTVPALGGSLVLPRFAWHPDDDTRDAGIDLGLSLRNIDLRQLGTALGWPAFEGTLSGDIPGVRYADSIIDLQGGLSMRMFDGDVRVDQLTLERPFGVAPTMTGAIAFTNLDLKPLTGAFGFGEITGRLGGHVRDLRLVDWQPVAFDAKFETSTSAKDPRRISQRAVRDLTEVGGGGLAAGLQAQVLKVFQTFGYARIGLSCTLANDVCTMGGLDGGSGGYTIVEGAGLPRVTVIGHQRRVDWPVLVARLKAATEGQVPIID